MPRKKSNATRCFDQTMSRKQTNESKIKDEPIDCVSSESLRAPNSTLRLRGAEIRQKNRKYRRARVDERRPCLSCE